LNKAFKNFTIYILILVIALAIYTLATPSTKNITEFTTSEFNQALIDGKIATALVTGDTNLYTIEGELTTGGNYYAEMPPDPTIIKTMQEAGISVNYKEVEGTSIWVTLLTTVLPMLLIMGVIIFFLQQSQGGNSKVMQFGKSKAKLHSDDRKKVTFADVAGVDEVKEELVEIVDFLKAPKKYTLLGAKIPKGVLLYGPPGTGKTLLARAVAGEAGVPFFTISGSDFVEMFVGVGASRVRDLFDQAKKQSPCIVFIDEIDAVGRHRGAGLGGGHDEREQTLNQLLVEMDGFAPNEGIIVVAATNRPDILDPALLRPGRFDRQITVDVPDVRGRREIIKVHIKGKPLVPGIDLEVLAKRTPGFTGADLANMVNESALLAARYGKKMIEMDDMEAAIERVLAGPEKKSRIISEFEKKLVSYHEAGHAVVSFYLDSSDPLHKVSIIPRGRAGGYTLLLPQEDRHYDTKNKMLDELVIYLGGRVAEELVLKDISTGASNDLERATELVRKMITRYGMSQELGPLTFGKDQTQVFLGRDISHERNYSEAIAFSIDKEARRIIDEAYEKTKKILTEHKDKLEEIAHLLMEKETIGAEEFYAVMKNEPILLDPVREDEVPAEKLAENPKEEETIEAQTVEEEAQKTTQKNDFNPPGLNLKFNGKDEGKNN